MTSEYICVPVTELESVVTNIAHSTMWEDGVAEANAAAASENFREGTADGELDLSAPRADLHSMRAANPSLDERAFSIQNRAIAEAAARLLRDVPEAMATLRGRRVLVTGVSGYLGAALAGLARRLGCEVTGLDIRPPNDKTAALLADVPVHIESASDVGAVREAAGDGGASIVFHVAALHAPHASHHTEAEFVEANVDSVAAVLSTPGAEVVVATSTTSHTITARVKARMRAGECVWLTDAAGGDADDPPRNKYGRTKREAERLFLAAAAAAGKGSDDGLAVVILRAPRFFCEDLLEGSALSLPNAMLNELLGRRAALVDLMTAHVRAALCAPALSGRVLTLAAPWPARLLGGADVNSTRSAEAVAEAVAEAFGRDALAGTPGWSLPASVDRVYDSSNAVTALGWRPQYTFERVLERLRAGDEVVLKGLY